MQEKKIRFVYFVSYIQRTGGQDIFYNEEVVFKERITQITQIWDIEKMLAEKHKEYYYTIINYQLLRIEEV